MVTKLDILTMEVKDMQGEKKVQGKMVEAQASQWVSPQGWESIKALNWRIRINSCRSRTLLKMKMAKNTVLVDVLLLVEKNGSLTLEWIFLGIISNSRNERLSRLSFERKHLQNQYKIIK